MSEDAPETTRIAAMWRRLPFPWALRSLLSAVLVFILTISAIVVCKPQSLGEFGISTPFGYARVMADRSGWGFTLKWAGSEWLGEERGLLVPFEVSGDLVYPGPNDSWSLLTLAEEYEIGIYKQLDGSSFLQLGIGMGVVPYLHEGGVFLSQTWVTASCAILLWFQSVRRLIQRLRNRLNRRNQLDS